MLAFFGLGFLELLIVGMICLAPLVVAVGVLVWIASHQGGKLTNPPLERCTECGQPAPPGAAYCPQCGCPLHGPPGPAITDDPGGPCA